MKLKKEENKTIQIKLIKNRSQKQINYFINMSQRNKFQAEIVKIIFFIPRLKKIYFRFNLTTKF